jgi:hypothetical protein
MREFVTVSAHGVALSLFEMSPSPPTGVLGVSLHGDSSPTHDRIRGAIRVLTLKGYLQVRNTPAPTQNMTAVAIHPRDLR